MTQELDDQLQRLAIALESTQAAPADPLRRLAEALIPDPDYSHQQAEQELPLYVPDQLLGRPVARLYPALHRHLLHCQQCAELHVALLADLGEQQASTPVPPARLAFLYPARLRRFSEQATEAILTVLRPASLSELAVVAEVFFDRLGDQLDKVSLQPAVQTAFNFSSGTPPALRYLAATVVATRRLDAELSPSRVTALRAAEQLETAIHRMALAVAFDLQLGKEALPFANEYTRWLLRQLDDLPRLD